MAHCGKKKVIGILLITLFFLTSLAFAKTNDDKPLRNFFNFSLISILNDDSPAGNIMYSNSEINVPNDTRYFIENPFGGDGNGKPNRRGHRMVKPVRVPKQTQDNQ